MTIATTSLGDRSYLAHDGSVAVVIDPQRDIDRVLDVARSEGVRVTHVFETHIHNDYVTGGLALARRTGAAYVVSAGDPVAFARLPAADGDAFRTGRLVITALATPGHTANHLAYELAEDGEPPTAVFTGGSMLFGAVGRTDLVGPECTIGLTRAQYRSVRHLAAVLPASAEVFPTHGFGSFCSSSPTSGDRSTIGEERSRNVALVLRDEDAFVKALMEGLGSFPRYYAHMAPANLAGPCEPDLRAPTTVDPVELRARIDGGEWVVDLRRRRAFARQHVTGTISIEVGEGFATFLGWAIPWDVPLTVIGDSPDEVFDAQRELVRVGIDRLAGAAVGSTEDLARGRTSTYPVASFAELAAVSGRATAVVLDVRSPEEWATRHLAGAVNIPFWELETRLPEVPLGEVWVHCQLGLRASIGASILDRAGRDVVLVDDDWATAEALGIPMASGG
ncbi:MAG: MBL fold metallo-hydrolase [Acidimicrobiales bacterium]